MTAGPRRPLGMVGRIALVLLCAVALEFLGNVALHQWQTRELIAAERVDRLAVKLADAERVALASHPRDRGRLMQSLGGDGLALNWVQRTVITDFSASLAPLATMRERLVRAEPRLSRREVRLSLLPSAEPGRRDLVGAFRLADGSFVTFRAGPYLAAPLAPVTVIVLHLLLIAAVMGVALAMVRALVRPLTRLAESADATGNGQAGAIVAEGPHEVRRVATAFAAMQARLLRAVEDHTHALVAVSHDLRTPIQRLRLRAALLRDPEARDAITGDLIEMEHFIDSTLAYFRTGEDETPRLVDAAAIVSTAADSTADLGIDIAYRGPDELVVTTRPIALKRMIANLIDNAGRHGEHILLTLAQEGERFVVTVEDDGPGIPGDRRAEALLPFRRLDTRRGKQAGGAGLGLAAVLKAAESLGGGLELGTSDLGGLAARLSLPISLAALPPSGGASVPVGGIRV